MKSERELFDLAKMYVMLEMDFEKDFVAGLEIDEELKYEMEQIRNILLEKKYDVDKFLEYKALYKKMTVGEYLEFIKTLK
jgi:hypothetical protein